MVGVYIYNKHHRTMVPPPPHRTSFDPTDRPGERARPRRVAQVFERVNLPAPSVNALTPSVSFPSHPVALLSHVVALAQPVASSRAAKTKQVSSVFKGI